MRIKARTRLCAAAAGGGLLIFGGLAAAPAFAYPPGQVLDLTCDRVSYPIGETAVCKLTNMTPGCPSDIVPPEGATPAGGPTVVGNTHTESFVVPPTAGTFTVAGTCADETAQTVIEVIDGRARTPKAGANVAFGLLAGLAALGVGGGLFAASRRRRV